jgi:hypothetical protein
MKFNLLAVFFIFFTYQAEVFAKLERCESSDTSKWTNCFGPAIFDGDTYVGSFKNGVPHGKGTYTYSDGATYVGGFLNGKESGEGVFNCWVHGATYVGSFKKARNMVLEYIIIQMVTFTKVIGVMVRKTARVLILTKMAR